MARVVVERLSRQHDRSSFDCGNANLNDFLKTKARKHASQNVSVTWVAVRDGDTQIMGFVTLTMGAVAFADADPEVVKGLPSYPLPVMHVGQLGTDVRAQGKGIGSLLLRFAAERAIDTSKSVGIFALELVAIDQNAYDFYVRRGFRPLRSGTMRLYLPITHLRASDARNPGAPER